MVSYPSRTRGVKVLGWLRVVAITGMCCTHPVVHAELNVPEEMGAALGWRVPVREGMTPGFDITSEPARWPEARKLAEKWVADMPDFTLYPQERILRRLAWMQTLALNAADPGVAEELRAERRKLAEMIRQEQATAKEKNRSAGVLAEVVRRLDALQKVLGPWLADSPAEQLEMLREEMKRVEGTTRAELAGRHGGEVKLAAFLRLSHEKQTLEAELARALADRKTPEPERELAVRRARGALGYFNGYNQEETGWKTATQDPEFAKYVDPIGRRHERRLKMPDMVSALGEDAMTRVLMEAFLLPVQVELNPDTMTGRLALRLIVEGKVIPERTPWSLIGWPDGGANEQTAGELAALYDRLKTSRPDFATSWKEDEWPRGRALACLAYALAAVDRKDEGEELLSLAGADKSGFGYKEDVSPAVAAKAWELVNDVAGANPDQRAWDVMTTVARKAELADALVMRAARGAEAATEGSPEAVIWRNRQGWALVAMDKFDEGLALLVTDLEHGPETTDAARLAEWSASKGRLLRLAHALQREELAAQIEERLVADFRDPDSSAWESRDLFTVLAERLFEAKKDARVLELLEARTARLQKPGVVEGERVLGRDVERRTALQFVDTLGRQGLHERVLEVAARPETFESKDLAHMLNASGGTGWRPLALVIAEALHATGRSEEAAAIVEAYLVKNGGSDPAYGLYVKIKGEGATVFFDRLFAMDRYEERPLIWKAKLLLDAGNPGEAEKVVKRAIAIDPSDGEQPKGDRMRAYAVLREILLQKNDQKQAVFFEGVVAAIRRSEEADDLARAGLRTRAIEVYQEALRSFADAYCIQSRLARNLARQGRFAEAAEHYKRAFELMPDSFGRVESHCFGCEQAFDGETAQALAERVFLEIASRPGAKAQVYYLLGYLRAQQERWEEAAGYLTRAVSIDPDYLNAWKKLHAVLPRTTRPQAELDRTVLRLLVLDPAGRRTNVSVNNVRDLAGLWEAYAEASALVPTSSSRLYPLGSIASKAVTQSGFEARSPVSPREHLARHHIMQALRSAMDSVYRWSKEEGRAAVMK
jgi:tetratricopeptide (TPR) repeat protein